MAAKWRMKRLVSPRCQLSYSFTQIFLPDIRLQSSDESIFSSFATSAALKGPAYLATWDQTPVCTPAAIAVKAVG
jgi:hypothetical protein